MRTHLTKAVFLDRDGTIIFDDHYLREPTQVRLLPGAKEALSMLRQSGYRLFLFTNQSGVGRGYFTLESVHQCNKRMLDLLELGSELFDDVCIAIERPDEPIVYRKPSPNFIKESIHKFALDPAKSWMVGDKLIDVQAGVNAGINAAKLGSPDSHLPAATRCFPSLLDFALEIQRNLV
jgi:D-glycero-D-manno-heptose 1,7-bisphosphate phosphatase